LPTPDEWRSEVDQALFGTDDDAPPHPGQPGSLDFSVGPAGESEHHVVDADTLDAALFGAREASAVAPAPPAEPAAPSPVPDDAHEIFAGDESFEEDRTFDEDEHETIVAEPADAEELAEPTGPERGRRRAWMLAGFTALVVVIGGTAGALMVGRSDDARQKETTVSARTTVATTTAPTTLPVPETTAPPVTSAPPPASTAPRTPATSRRTVPPPQEPVVEPPPAPPPPTEPPPTSPPTAPPSTSADPSRLESTRSALARAYRVDDTAGPADELHRVGVVAVARGVHVAAADPYPDVRAPAAGGDQVTGLE
jgi:hypothetical protein